jgi:sulfide:quinone oxidoreductase
MILFMPGMAGPKWLEKSGLSLSAGGMVKANQYTQAEDAELVYVVGDSGSFKGPDWMPKQAHMADLQAAAAAKNILAELDNKPVTATFKIELICIIDSLDKGILVFRNLKRTIVFPCRFLHYAKRFFEWLYLRDYR